MLTVVSTLIDIPSNIFIHFYDAVFELATAFGLIVTYGMLVVVIAVFIVPDSIWVGMPSSSPIDWANYMHNAIWPAKPVELKEQMEKQNREEKELEKQLGYSDGHRRLLSDEISDLELEKVGMKAAKGDRGKGKEVITEEKTAEVRDEKASWLSAVARMSWYLHLGGLDQPGRKIEAW